MSYELNTLIYRRVTAKHSPPPNPRCPDCPSPNSPLRTEREAEGGRSTGLLFLAKATGQKDSHFSFAPLPPFQSLVNTAEALPASPHLRFPSLVCPVTVQLFSPYYCPTPSPRAKPRAWYYDAEKTAGFGDVSYQPGISGRIWLISFFPRPQWESCWCFFDYSSSRDADKGHRKLLPYGSTQLCTCQLEWSKYI